VVIIMYTNDMKFIESHEWVKLVDETIAMIGISDHAQGLLGDLVYIELPKVGAIISAQKTFGVVESVKAASDLYAPLDGEVVAVNDAAIGDPTLVNTHPHTDGWLIKIKITDRRQLDSLLDVNAYQALIG
jgi:glycine cleavage system H protein